ncbi:hypothetical protein M0Q50_02375 [bacterium]|jgi:hypothetical protein|nr:hypothetical protein [bacterium]
MNIIINKIESYLFIKKYQLDNIEIKFNFMKDDKNSLFYFCGYDCLFEQIKKQHRINVNAGKVWDIWNLYYNVGLILEKIFFKYFNIEGYSIKKISEYSLQFVEYNFSNF